MLAAAVVLCVWGNGSVDAWTRDDDFVEDSFDPDDPFGIGVTESDAGSEDLPPPLDENDGPDDGPPEYSYVEAARPGPGELRTRTILENKLKDGKITQEEFEHICAIQHISSTFSQTPERRSRSRGRSSAAIALAPELSQYSGTDRKMMSMGEHDRIALMVAVRDGKLTMNEALAQVSSIPPANQRTAPEPIPSGRSLRQATMEAEVEPGAWPPWLNFELVRAEFELLDTEARSTAARLIQLEAEIKASQEARAASQAELERTKASTRVAEARAAAAEEMSNALKAQFAARERVIVGLRARTAQQQLELTDADYKSECQERLIKVKCRSDA